MTIRPLPSSLLSHYTWGASTESMLVSSVKLPGAIPASFWLLRSFIKLQLNLWEQWNPFQHIFTPPSSFFTDVRPPSSHAHNPTADLLLRSYGLLWFPNCTAHYTIQSVDVAVCEWTDYSRLFKEQRPRWKQSLNDKTTHCHGKRMEQLCLCVRQISLIRGYASSCVCANACVHVWDLPLIIWRRMLKLVISPETVTDTSLI